MRSSRSPDPVHAEQVRSSYAHLPLTLAISVLNSVVLGFVLAPVVSKSRVVVWVGLVVGLSALRLILWFVHRRLDVEKCHHVWWTRLAMSGTFASGILWGCGVFVFAPLDETHLLFLALVISGMCAGAATVHAAHFPSVVAFIAPAILPLAANFFMQGNRLQVALGLMASIFGISLCIASLTFRRWFNETTSARLALARRTAEIDEINIQLKAEIERHQSTEKKLQHAQKMDAIGRLTAGIAHDFNNLLMAISGSADLVFARLGPGTAHAPQFEIIIQSVERGATLTRQLLAFGRQQTLLPHNADINQVVLGIEELLETTLGGYGHLKFQLAATPTIAFVDTTELEHAILNLVINARDATLNGGSITVKTANLELDGTSDATEGLVGKAVMISVADTGTGMSEAVRLHAFDPFFTTKEIGKGSGLGLSQVYGLVQQSGGVIHIDSHLGRGTTVSIYLPRVESHLVSAVTTRKPIAATALADTGSSSAQKVRRILLLDDDDQTRETVAAMLEASGYTVTAFGTALQALREVGGPHNIDLMIVDFAMPDMRGDQFAAKARTQRRTVPILFITGYAEPISLQSEPWVLRKPFGVTTLVSAAEEAMRVMA